MLRSIGRGYVKCKFIPVYLKILGSGGINGRRLGGAKGFCDILDTVAQLGGAVTQIKGDGLVAVCTYLKRHRGGGSAVTVNRIGICQILVGGLLAGQNLFAAEGGVLGNSVNFGAELGNLLLNGGTVGGRIGAVSRLKCQGADPLVHGGHFVESSFCSLGEGNTVLSIAITLIKTVNLGCQTVGNLETGCIVLGTVDAETGGQTLVGGVQGICGICHHALGIQG